MYLWVLCYSSSLLFLCAYLPCTAQQTVDPIIFVGFQRITLEVVEGNNATVCVFTDSDIVEDLEFEAFFVLEFITADMEDIISSTIPTRLESQCINITTLGNDDGNNTTETFAIRISTNDSLVETFPSGILITILEAGCTRGSVLPLIGGVNARQGLVEICIGDGQYSPIQLETFTIREASIFCREMGLGTAGFPLSATNDFGIKGEFDVVTSVICTTGVEESLSACMMSTLTGNIENIAAVQCIDDPRSCMDGEIRLISDPSNMVEGRLEICFEGVWGAVFDPYWSALDAAVTCSQLGFETNGGALPIVPAIYPTDPAFLPIVYDFPACDDITYDSILDCPRQPMSCGEIPLEVSGNGSGTGPRMGMLGTLSEEGTVGTIALNGVVGVKCEVFPASRCDNFDVRLSYRERSGATGNLEICIENTWRKVCEGLISSSVINVACRSLGFRDFEATSVQPQFLDTSISSSKQGYFSFIDCDDSEELQDCSLTTASVIPCSDVRIECLARPQIFLNPLVRSGLLVVEEKRRVTLDCFVDSSNHPPVTGLQIIPGIASHIDSLCPTASVLFTSSSDSGEYRCEAVSDGDIRTFLSVNVTVKEPNRVTSVSQLRLSTSLQQDNEQFNITALENLVFQSINVNIPGQQRVSCMKVARREVERTIDANRIECLLLNFDSSPDINLGEVLTATLPRLFSGILFSLSTSDIGFCDFDQTVLLGETISWPESKADELITLVCPGGEDGNTTRLCNATGEWQAPNTSVCLINFLNQLLNANITEEEFEMQLNNTVSALQVTLNDPNQQTSMVLSAVLRLFEGVAGLLNNTNLTISQQVVSGLVDTLGVLQQWTTNVFVEDDSSSRIINSFEMIANRFAEGLEVNDTVSVVVPEQIVFVAENAPLDILIETGRNFSVDNNTFNSGEPASNTLGSISLPPSLFLNVSNRTNTEIVFTLYTTPVLFPFRESKPDPFSSQVTGIGSSVLGADVEAGLEFDNVDTPILINLQLTAERIIRGSESCVFWDFAAANGQGNWSTEGCTTVLIVNNTVTCECSHLTNFAILVDICTRTDSDCMPSPLDEVLSFVSYIGIALSMIGLIFTIITILVFKRVRERDVSKYHIQLSIAIFCMLLVFAAGIDRTSVYGGCVAVSALLHYFTLVAVMWMGAESLLLFQKLVFVFKKNTNTFIIIVSLVCWLSPIVPVLIPLIFDLANGDDPSDDLLVRREEFCFLDNKAVFFGAFLGPIFVILSMNVFLFVVVLVVLVRHTKSTLARRGASIGVKTTLRLLVSISGIMALFGLTWLFAALTITVSVVRTPAQIIFAVLNSLQGFFIFLFYCVLNKVERESWKELLSCGRYQSKYLNPNLKSSGGHTTDKNKNFNSPKTASLPLSTNTLENSSFLPLKGNTLENSFSPFKGNTLENSSFLPLSTNTLENSGNTLEETLTTSSDMTLLTHNQEHSQPDATFKSTPEKESHTPSDIPVTSTRETEYLTAADRPVINGVRDEVAAKKEPLIQFAEEPKKARIKRYSTRRHGVEEFEIDFYDSSEGEEIEEDF